MQVSLNVIWRRGIVVNYRIQSIHLPTLLLWRHVISDSLFRSRQSPPRSEAPSPPFSSTVVVCYWNQKTTWPFSQFSPLSSPELPSPSSPAMDSTASLSLLPSPPHLSPKRRSGGSQSSPPSISVASRSLETVRVSSLHYRTALEFILSLRVCYKASREEVES